MWLRTGDLDVCVVSLGVVLDNATETHCVPRLFEFPERVSVQIRA